MGSVDTNECSASQLPLAGVRVLAIGAFVAGNLCPLVLAELGADVVKIESRRRPEPLREFYSADHPTVFEPSGVQTTSVFTGLARSMRSICIELDEPLGTEMVHRLAEQADIFIENLGPGVIEKLGCSYRSLAATNPSLIVVSISGYGRTGPRSSYRAYASSIANFLGLTSVWTHDGTHFDYVAAYHGALAAIGALIRSRRTGRGGFVDMSQMDAGAAVMAPLYLDTLMNGRPWAFSPNEIPGSLLSAVVRCAGADAWVAVDIEDLDDWASLCDVVERPDLICVSITDTQPVADDLSTALQRWVEPLTPYQATIKLQRAGLAAAPVQTGEDVWRDAQLRTRGAFVEVDHPDLGMVEHLGSPDRFSSGPARVTGQARRLGEDTEVVLSDWLGLGVGDRYSYEAAGAIWQSPAVYVEDNDVDDSREP